MGERGKYQTRQKEDIADFFRAHPEQCLTADAVYAALGANVGMTTVYRAVSRLCEEGFLRRYAPQGAGTAAMYQYNHCTGHMHIRCVDCGTVAHLHCEEVDAFRGHLKQRHGFVLDECRTVLYGRCEQCEATHEPATCDGACDCAHPKVAQ